MRRARRAAVVLALTSLAAAQAVAAAAASADPPWPTGTVFVAAAGLRTSFGGVFAQVPGSGQQQLGSGSVNDVTVGSDGTVFWGDCNGNLFSYVPGVGSTLLRNVGSCVGAVAVEPDGSLLVDDSALLHCPATAGGSCTSLPYQLQANGLSVDPDGDVYAADGGGRPVVVPSGSTTPIVLSGLFDGSVSDQTMRFDSAGDLVTTVPFGHEAIVQPPDSVSSTSYTFGSYVDGAVFDTTGDLYASDVKDDPSTMDQLDEIPAGQSTPTVVQTGFDNPRGLASYPPVQALSRSPSSVTLSAQPASPISVVTKVTLDATVDGGGAGISGLVQFSADGSPLGDIVPVVNGVAELRTLLPAGGAEQLTATYLGTSTERPSTSDPQAYDVHKIASSTTLTTTSSATPPQDQPVHVTATVSGRPNHTPTGDVRFLVNGQVTQFGELDSNGQASADVNLRPGTSVVKAVYDGDDLFATSKSPALSFTTTAPYTPSIQTSVRYGSFSPTGRERIVIRARVHGVSGRPLPTGSVTADTGFACSPSTIDPADPVTSCVRYLASGEYDVTLHYSGDSVYAPSSTDVFLLPGG